MLNEIVRTAAIAEIPLPDRIGRKGYKLPIQVFFDESGHCDLPGVVFGGLVIDSRFTAAAAAAWISVLKSESIESTSMKDAMSFRGDYAHWNGSRKDLELRRDSLLEKLALAASREVSVFISAPVSIKDFKSMPESARKKFKDPRYLGFYMCMRKAMKETPVEEKIQICYDNSQECSPEILKLYQLMRTTDPAFKAKCQSLTFGEDESFALLQFADMYAYCVREHETKRESMRPIIGRLLAILEPGGYANHFDTP